MNFDKLKLNITEKKPKNPKGTKECRSCNATIHFESGVCPRCGEPQ